MSDYISREAAIEAIEERSCYNCGAIPKNCETCRTRDHIKAVLNVPAADVEPVVRCKDCKYKGCALYCLNFDDEWFCADGERRTE